MTQGEFEARPEYLAASEALLDLLLPNPMVPNAVADVRVSPAQGIVGAWRLSMSPVARDTAVASVQHIVDALKTDDFFEWELPIRLLLTVDEFQSLCATMGADPQG
jgi:hypothetical protein